MGRVADTRWRTYPWDVPPGAASGYEAPFGGAEYVQTRDALDSVTALHDEVAFRPPPLSQIQAFPPRYGYDRTQRGIEEILSTARLYPDQSRSLSGTEAGYTGSPRNHYGSAYG